MKCRLCIWFDIDTKIDRMGNIITPPANTGFCKVDMAFTMGHAGCEAFKPTPEYVEELKKRLREIES